jgi:hypothetical protein
MTIKTEIVCTKSIYMKQTWGRLLGVQVEVCIGVLISLAGAYAVFFLHQGSNMALPQAVSRLIGRALWIWLTVVLLTLLIHSYTVPVAIGVATLQASIYDVPGGYRAVMFDRFQGVKGVVSCCKTFRDLRSLIYILTGLRRGYALSRAMAPTCNPLRRSHQT